jgi:HAD superfamily hydrolase (TIGR01549 family)
MISRRVKLILLDWDGVVCDSLPTFFGLYRQHFPKYQKDIEHFRNHIAEHCANGKNFLPGRLSDYTDTLSECILFPGILEMLKVLHHHRLRLVLVSNSPYYLIDLLLRRYKIRNVFEEIYSSDCRWHKPGSRLLSMILARFDLPETETVFVGDQISDVLFVKTKVFLKLLSTYGFHPESHLRATVHRYRVKNVRFVRSSQELRRELESLCIGHAPLTSKHIML